MDVTRTAVLLLVIPLTTVTVGVARAEDPKARADALFDAGKRLIEAGAVDEACRAFAQSYELDPSGGSLLNLGICYEKQEKFATARETLTKARDRAIVDGRVDRQGVAESHLAAVTSRVAWVRLRFDPAIDRERCSVEIDGRPWPSALWGEPWPVDPGEHVLLVHGVRDEPQSITFEAANTAEEQTLVIAPKPPSAPTASPPRALRPPPLRARVGAEGPESAPSWLVPLGVTGLALGAVGVGVGIGFGVDALAKQREVESLCPRTACTNQSAVQLSGVVDRHATISTATTSIGVLISVGSAAALVTAQLAYP